MKKVLRSTFGTLVVAAFLAIAPPTYARGGHGGGHGGPRGQHGGHAVRAQHAAAGHVTGRNAGFRARGGRAHYFARSARGQARFAGRAYNWNGGRHWGGGYWGGNYWYPSSGYSLGYYGLGYGYPYYGIGYYGYPYGGYYGPYYGYYPYRYGYWPSVSFSFGY
jgi:hypothetical protein